jgi:hypothetical protein
MTEDDFRVGDKAVCVENNINDIKYIGKIGTIIHIQGVYFPYKLRFKNGDMIWCEVRKPLEIELLLDGL